jgi:hypothetical protein
MAQQEEQIWQQEEPKSIIILQLNLNKSQTAHLNLLNKNLSTKYDIILLQEPHATSFRKIRTPTNFRQVFPSNMAQEDSLVQSVIWVNRKLDTKDWDILEVLDTNDITAIQLKGPYGKLAIFNVYNDCTHSKNERALGLFIHWNTDRLCRTENHHMPWVGDFNRHHPLWDRDEDTHLFTRQATEREEGLIRLLADYDMEMAYKRESPLYSIWFQKGPHDPIECLARQDFKT